MTTHVCHLKVTEGHTAADIIEAGYWFVLKRSPKYILLDCSKVFRLAKTTIEGMFIVLGKAANSREIDFKREFAMPNAQLTRLYRSACKVCKKGLKVATLYE